MGHEKQAAPSFPVSLGHRFTLAWAQEEEMKSQILENQGQQGLRKHRAPQPVADQPRLGQVVEIVFVTHTDSCLLFLSIPWRADSFQSLSCAQTVKVRRLTMTASAAVVR